MFAPRIALAALRLYLVTDETACAGHDLLEVVEAAVAGGVTCVQLREKHLDTREFVERACALKALLEPHNVPLIINDRLDVALACGADGLHIGQSDMPFELSRQLLPARCAIGLSIERPEDLVAAGKYDVDYFGISPVFATSTKTDTAQPWGLKGLRACRYATRVPLVGIGGISAENAEEVFRAGADGIAVVSAICSAESPFSAAAALNDKIRKLF